MIYVLEVKGLDFDYGGEPILRNISFSASRGRIISLIGPNGSGKSTLLRCLCGLLPVSNRGVRIMGRALEEYSSRELSRLIAFLPQAQDKVPSMSVYELVGMGRSPYHRSGWFFSEEDRQKMSWALEYMSLMEIADRSVEELSGGERQRAWIAMILAQDTSIVLLDEPVTYMDLKFQWELLAVLRDLRDSFGKTVVSVFHDINHALEISDFIYLLKDGRIHSAGRLEQVINERSIREVFGVGTHVCRFKKCRRPVVVPFGDLRCPGRISECCPGVENSPVSQSY
ncbi:ABC transporter ATP-binding protein [Dethiosulfovibrio sp. F2B]|nr:ABC transporter ATP-binding protein [Dethiosulfovibrio faecalis]MCF4152186.1 ABC transporter ATP-binding protein [Dethiosulfovibrio faecalis]